MKTTTRYRKTIGLALSSGAFRGFAHIGVIKTLEKYKIPIDFISGSSIGAWVAAYYAVFKNIGHLESDLINNPISTLAALFDPSVVGGFINGRKLSDYLGESLGHSNFSALKIPLRIVATDLISGRPFIFKAGDVARAVKASISVPLVFKPEPHKDKLLIDGALSNPVPISAAREMGADFIIAVNLYNQNEFVNRRFTMSKIALRSMRIVIHNLAKVDVKGAAIVIEPDCSSFVKEHGLGRYFTASVIRALIKIGEKAAEKAIPRIKKLLAE